MSKLHLIHWCLVLNILVLGSCIRQIITPNQFKGNDIQRIRSAIEAAKATNGKVFIPSRNSNGTNLWLLDSAILIPSNMTIILDNCTIQLSDQCRDNMFRSDNVGIGITDPGRNENISILGIGEVMLKGANNPRASGDGARTLALDPGAEKEKGNWRISYGSDAGKEGKKQKGDWRNIMILMANVDGFKLKNINIENSHAWAVSFERVTDADISDIRINNPEEVDINGNKVLVSNKDGINLRHGCKNFRIQNVSGRTGDDFIALSSLDTGADGHDNGNLNSTMVTSRKWKGPEDDTEEVVITNITCQTKYRGVAIRASDSASIHDVYINGLICREWDGYTNSILIGGIGYGKPSHPGKINNIYATNIIGGGRSLILIEAAIADCVFMNGIYTGDGDQIITYKIDKSKTTNIVSQNLIKAH
jgi:polygalacturonase